MLWKALGLGSCVCALASAAAAATEIALEFDAQPVFALAGPGGTDLSVARYQVGGIEVELSALGSGFGYVEQSGDPGENVAPFVGVNGQMQCGNQNDCEPFVANFSVALDAVAVDFLGVGDFSGSGAVIGASTFFLAAFSGPDATGALVASLSDPGGVPGAPRAGGGFELPATLAAAGPAIRSIVFGAAALHDLEAGDHNLSIVERIRMTIPEPSTAGLVLLGLLALRRRSRGKNGRAAGRAGEIRTLDLQTPSLAR